MLVSFVTTRRESERRLAMSLPTLGVFSSPREPEGGRVGFFCDGLNMNTAAAV